MDTTPFKLTPFSTKNGSDPFYPHYPSLPKPSPAGQAPTETPYPIWEPASYERLVFWKRGAKSQRCRSLPCCEIPIL